MDNYYLPGAEPFFIPGGSVGCVLVHGLASSPQEMKWLGEAISARGITVCGPRLAGHGTDYRDLRPTRWRDWLGAVLDACHILRGQCDRVFIAGHSTGGTLALLAATLAPVDGVAVLAAPVIFRSRLVANSHWIRHLRPFLHAPDTTDLPQRIREEQARRGEPELGRVRYDYWATNALMQLDALAKATRGRLPLVKAPLLALYSTQDKVVAIESCEIIAQSVGSARLEKHLLHNSQHNLMLDGEREAVFALVGDFIAQVAAEN